MNAERLSIRRLFLPILSALFISCRPGADFKVSVRVIDEVTGQPISDAWVLAAIAVRVEPEREPPYNRAVAGARAKTNRRGIAVFREIEGIYWGEEPRDKLWLMLESRKPKVKRTITLMKEGDLFVFAKDYGALHHPLHFKGTPQEHAALGPFGIKGEDKAILLDPAVIKEGFEITIKMAKPDRDYLYGSFHPDTFLPAIWAATSKKTGSSKAEKRAVYDFFVTNLAPLAIGRPEDAYDGHIKPEALLDPKVRTDFIEHGHGMVQRHDTKVHEWMTQKALELLPPGYEEFKEYAQEIMAGVREEEEGTRPLNHYYNPYDPDDAMPGGETALKWGAIGYPDNPMNEWDWEDAVRYYRAGEKARAYRTLGHVLHLLQDLSVPMQTHIIPHDNVLYRNAAHFEDFFSRLAKEGNGQLPPSYSAQARRPRAVKNIAEHFDGMARMTFGRGESGGGAVDIEWFYAQERDGFRKKFREPDDEALRVVAKRVFPAAIESGAGLMVLFSRRSIRRLSARKDAVGSDVESDVNPMALPERSSSVQSCRLDSLRRVSAQGVDASIPVWTPDSKAILFSEIPGVAPPASSHGVNFKRPADEKRRQVDPLYRATLSGDEHRLLAAEVDFYSLKFSPDGSEIAFKESFRKKGADRRGDRRLSLVATASQASPVEPEIRNWFPAVSGAKKSRLPRALAKNYGLQEESKDGRLVIAEREGEVDIFRGNPLSLSRTVTLPSSTSNVLGISLSPAGSEAVLVIATRYTRTPDSLQLHAADLYIVNERGELRQLTATPDAIEFAATWSPDGRSIAYLDNRDPDFTDKSGGSSIWVGEVVCR